MRVLIVGMATSVHTVRFIELLQGGGHEVHLFGVSLSGHAHPDLAGCRLHVTNPEGDPPRHVTVEGPPATDACPRQIDHLRHILDTISPDIVHVHETSEAGALVSTLIGRDGDLGVPWLLTNWGSDLYWFGRQPAYVPTLRRVMAACPNLTAECHRDIALARAFGFRGRVLGVWPVAGGIDREHADGLRSPGPTSSRRAVAFKGMTAAYGQALVALEAVARCGDLLAGWELLGHQVSDDAATRAREIAAATGMAFSQLSDIRVRDSPHDDLLAMHGRARVSIGLNRSDGLSTSFLEAIAMGSFPVQADTACGRELTPAGRGALFVPHDDVDAVAAALRRALTDDALVDGAAAINAHVTAEFLDRRRIRARVLDAYDRVVTDASWDEAA